MGLGHSPRIVTDGLVLSLDAQNSKSWKSGTTWTDTFGGNNGTLTNGTSHSDGPFPEAGYVEFDGSTEYLSIADSADFTFGTGDYTMEAWIYPTSTGSYPVIIAQYENTSTTASWFFSLGDNTTTVEYYAYSPDGNLSPYLSGGTASLNTWTHVAVTRSGSTMRLFVGGSQVDSGTWSNTHRDSSLPVTIGASSNGLYKFSGNISNVRIVKGTALYTSDFTPPSSPLTAVTNTKLLCCQGGTNVDASPSAHSFQVIIGVPTLTSVGPSATKYFEFDGTNDCVDVTNNANLYPGTGDFTAEVWCRGETAASDYYYLLSNYGNSGSNYYGWWITTQSNGSGIIAGMASGSGATSVSISNTTVNLNDSNWHHVVFVRSGNAIRLYHNGEQLESDGDVTGYNVTSSEAKFRIGKLRDPVDPNGGYYFWNGKISGVKIYKGKGLTAAEVQQNYNALKGRYV